MHSSHPLGSLCKFFCSQTHTRARAHALRCAEPTSPQPSEGSIHLRNSAFRGYFGGNQLITPSVVSQSTHAPIHQRAAICQSPPPHSRLLAEYFKSESCLPLVCVTAPCFVSARKSERTPRLAECVSGESVCVYVCSLNLQLVPFFFPPPFCVSVCLSLAISRGSPFPSSRQHVWRACATTCRLPNLLLQSYGWGTAVDILYRAD